MSLSTSIDSFFADSSYHMANIINKRPTFRRAVTVGTIYVGEVGFHHIKHQTLPKGDVLKLAEIAGVQGAKNAWQQIPMCHPLLLDHVAIYPELDEANHCVHVYAVVATTAKTGVEMEAMAAVQAALLTLYDLTKPVFPALTLTNSRLLLKEGGKKGLWLHPDGVPEAILSMAEQNPPPPLAGVTCGVITLSDRASSGIYEDRSGQILCDAFTEQGAELSHYQLIADEADALRGLINEWAGTLSLIVTTGGTGVSPRDITVDTISALADFTIDGIGERLRSYGASNVPTAWLSRSVAVSIKGTLVICLPGSVGGVKDGVAALQAILPHCLKLLNSSAKKEAALA